MNFRTIFQKDEFNCYLQSSISSICKRFGGEDLHNPDVSCGRTTVEREILMLMRSISLKEENFLKTEAEKVMGSSLYLCLSFFLSFFFLPSSMLNFEFFVGPLRYDLFRSFSES